jgi:hypothetical protein
MGSGHPALRVLLLAVRHRTIVQAQPLLLAAGQFVATPDKCKIVRDLMDEKAGPTGYRSVRIA